MVSITRPAGRLPPTNPASNVVHSDQGRPPARTVAHTDHLKLDPVPGFQDVLPSLWERLRRPPQQPTRRRRPYWLAALPVLARNAKRRVEPKP